MDSYSSDFQTTFKRAEKNMEFLENKIQRVQMHNRSSSRFILTVPLHLH